MVGDTVISIFKNYTMFLSSLNPTVLYYFKTEKKQTYCNKSNSSNK